MQDGEQADRQGSQTMAANPPSPPPPHTFTRTRHSEQPQPVARWPSHHQIAPDCLPLMLFASEPNRIPPHTACTGKSAKPYRSNLGQRSSSQVNTLFDSRGASICDLCATVSAPVASSSLCLSWTTKLKTLQVSQIYYF